MKKINDLIFNGEFNDILYEKLIIEFKENLKIANYNSQLDFQEKHSLIDIDLQYNRLNYFGKRITYIVKDGANIIGTFDGFRDLKNNFLIIFCV